MILFWLEGEIFVLLIYNIIKKYLQQCCQLTWKLKVLIFFWNALMDGSSFACSGSAFQIHATVNAKLFPNIEVRAVGISKLNLEFQRS